MTGSASIARCTSPSAALAVRSAPPSPGASGRSGRCSSDPAGTPCRRSPPAGPSRRPWAPAAAPGRAGRRRARSSSCTRIGTSRSPASNLASAGPTSPIVADADRLGEERRRDAEPGGEVEARPDPDFRPVEGRAGHDVGDPRRAGASARRARRRRWRRCRARRRAPRARPRAGRSRRRNRSGCRAPAAGARRSRAPGRVCVTARSALGL